jgi:hypothetical protein
VTRIFWVAAALWLTLGLLTLTGYPGVWIDEILSADAGIHLAQGKGFVSAAWFNQPSWEFWASYTPLYAFTLAGWLKLFGISAFAVRSFGFLLITAALAMGFLFVRRFAGETDSWFIIAALAVGEPLAFLERAGRPDSVSVFLLFATALVFVSRNWQWRAAALFILGALALPAALQYTAFVVLLGLLLQLWYRPFTRGEIRLWLAGAGCGAAILTALYASHGVLKIFVESTVASKHSSAGRMLQQIILRHGAGPFVFSDIVMAPLRDFATPVLLGCGLWLWAAAKQTRRVSSFGVTCALVIPVAIQLLGKYPIYYTYMGGVPATIAVLAACCQLGAKGRIASAVVLGLLCVGGVGRLDWKAWRQGSETIADASLDQISASDTVVADYPAYYQLLGRTRELFAVGYAGGKVMPHFPPEQASHITKLLVRDSMFEELATKVGGQWQRTGDVLVMRHGAVSRLVTIDDETRRGYRETIGLYVRAGNKNLSALGAR